MLDQPLTRRRRLLAFAGICSFLLFAWSLLASPASATGSGTGSAAPAHSGSGSGSGATTGSGSGSGSAASAHGHGGKKHIGHTLPMWSVLPFAALLLCIALLPVLAEHWWESNRNKGIVALLLGLPVAIYLWPQDNHAVLHALHEYVAFIALLGALYIISGGLLLRGDIKATPGINATFLGTGAVLANFIGTTGAAMLLIRPLLRTNSQRKHTRHIPIFFIFIVANMGGMLTPLGDPPLFLGFLRGVPFFWTLKLLPIWGTAVGLCLIVFYFWDRRAYAREAAEDLVLDSTQQQPLSLVGKANILLLLGVIASVLVPSMLGVSDIVREVGMVLMAVISLVITPKALRKENNFTFHPIVEVAALFIGIFLAMAPATAILQARGAELGMTKVWQFFWATGLLSSFLDNAPTYVSFLSLAQGIGLRGDVVGVPTRMLEAISAGSVLMGANSYIGNGPNFMVKAIADEAKIKMPNFFGYMLMAALVLWPIFGVITVVFFR
ncbi:MAG: sodium:proton antiporter [Myxococcales bacterium]|nr:sodium:proton antiporter [Myxococcales bacterium]